MVGPNISTPEGAMVVLQHEKVPTIVIANIYATSIRNRWPAKIKKKARAILELRRHAKTHLHFISSKKSIKEYNLGLVGPDMTISELSKLQPEILKEVIPHASAPPFDIFLYIAIGNTLYTTSNLDMLQDMYNFNRRALSEVAHNVAKLYTNQFRSLEWLFKHGADPNYVMNRRPLLLALATRPNGREAYRLAMLYGADATAGQNGKSVVDIAANRRTEFAAAGYFDFPTPISVIFSFMENYMKYLRICIQNGARLPSTTKYKKNRCGRLDKIISIEGVSPSVIEVLPRKTMPLLEACLDEFRGRWSIQNHFTWTREQREIIKTILLCLRRIPSIPPEVQLLILESGCLIRYSAY